MTVLLDPIRYNRREVALMVTFAVHFSPDLAPLSTSAMLELFGIQQAGRGYLWNPR
jgi:hypothetical protein